MKITITISARTAETIAKHGKQIGFKKLETAVASLLSAEAHALDTRDVPLSEAEACGLLPVPGRDTVRDLAEVQAGEAALAAPAPPMDEFEGL